MYCYQVIKDGEVVAEGSTQEVAKILKVQPIRCHYIAKQHIKSKNGYHLNYLGEKEPTDNRLADKLEYAIKHLGEYGNTVLYSDAIGRQAIEKLREEFPGLKVREKQDQEKKGKIEKYFIIERSENGSVLI